MIGTLLRNTVRTVLPNGLTLLVLRDSSAPVAAIFTHVRAGYFDETDDQVGVSHVVEHMYFKGTPSRGVGEIARETKLAGGYLNAHTIYDHTAYFTVLPSSSVERGLEIQFDAFANSLIDSDELARELEVIVQEAKRKRDTPSAVTTEALYALLHDRHRIRRWRIGEEQALRAFRRDMVYGFYRNWYSPSNTILAVTGDVDPEAVLRKVERLHGTLPVTTPVRSGGDGETGPSGFRVREWAGDIAQQHTAAGWRTPGARHVDTPALDLAATALGTGRASRLYRAVRERQLATSVSVWNMTARDAGVFSLHIESPPEKSGSALRYAWQEIMSARDVGFRGREVERAQRITESRWLRRLESAEGKAGFLSSWEAEGGVHLAAEYADRVLSLDRHDLQEAMQRHLGADDLGLVSYRPDAAAQLFLDSADAYATLRAVDSSASSVLPPPEIATPPSSPVITPAVSVGSPAREKESGPVMQYRTTGGVPLLVIRRPDASLVHFGVFQRGGTSLERAQNNGIARLMAQTMLKGTSSRSGTGIAEATEELGASIAVATGSDSLAWSLSVPTRRLKEAVDVLSDVIQNPIFPEEAVETERSLALSELLRMQDDMYRWPMHLARRAAFGSHPYSRTSYGTEESLAAISAQDVRDFHAVNVRKGSTVVALIGDVDPGEAADLLARSFRELEWEEEPRTESVVWPVDGRREIEERERNQTALALLFEGAGRSDERRFAARVLAAIASGLGGRFFEQLRDRRSLAYTVLAAPFERRSAGAFVTYIATSPEREEEARSGLLSEFQALAHASPRQHEVERARNYLIGSHRIAQQSSASVLAEVVDAWLFGSLDEIGAFEEGLVNVTASDVQRFALDCLNAGPPVEGTVRGVSR